MFTENRENIIRMYVKTRNTKKVSSAFGTHSGRMREYLTLWGVYDPESRDPRIYKPNDDFFDQMGEIQYWLLGLLASDGNVQKDRYVSLSQSGDEGVLLVEYVKNLLGLDTPLYTSKTIGRDAHRLQFTSQKIVQQLAIYNIVPNKTLKFTMPNIPDKHLKDFIRGYVDGDGSIGIYKHNGVNMSLSVSFIGTTQFIEECEQLIPINGHMYVRKDKPYLSEIKWSGERAVEFCDWIYSSDIVYPSSKFKVYSHFMREFPMKYMKYKIFKRRIADDLRKNPSASLMKLAEKYGLPFQTLYDWKKKGIFEEATV